MPHMSVIVPLYQKHALSLIAAKRTTERDDGLIVTVGQVVREAIQEYLERHGDGKERPDA